MHHNGNSSFRLIGYTMIYILLFTLNINSEVCETEKINNKISGAVSNSNLKKYMPYANIYLPTCPDFVSNAVHKENIPIQTMENSFRWINMYVNLQQCCIANEMYFSRMGINGDDWVVAFCENGCEQEKIKYLQYIDSRTLTIYVEQNIDIATILNKPQTIVSKNSYLNWSVIAPSEYIKIELNHTDTNEIFGTICVDTNYYYSNIPKEFYPHFWCNRVSIVFNFPKIHFPKRSVFGYDVNLTIGGIPDSSNVPYLIFNRQKGIDFKNVMFKIYPWITDSLKTWKSKSYSSEQK